MKRKKYQVFRINPYFLNYLNLRNLLKPISLLILKKSEKYYEGRIRRTVNNLPNLFCQYRYIFIEIEREREKDKVIIRNRNENMVN
jgi:hypothetical protein